MIFDPISKFVHCIRAFPLVFRKERPVEFYRCKRTISGTCVSGPVTARVWIEWVSHHKLWCEEMPFVVRLS